LILAIAILTLGITACAELQLRTLPPPFPTAKLRVFFLTVSDDMPIRYNWTQPHREFKANMDRQVARFLEGTGIYEIVPESDVQTVLAGQDEESIRWVDRTWANAKRAGRALNADYVVVARRGLASWRFYFFEMAWINLETGRVYETRNSTSSFLDTEARIEEFRNIVIQIYHEIFEQAKGDLLATAMRKGRLAQVRVPPPERPVAPPQAPVRTEAVPAAERADVAIRPPAFPERPTPESDKPGRPSARKSAAAKAPASVQEKDDTPAVARAQAPTALPPGREPRPLSAKTPPADGKIRLVVYDLEASQPMQVAGLILTEALRQEIFKLGSVDLVNREDVSRAAEELKLQQSGLVPDRDAVRVGRWLAVSQSVTGRLGVLGATMVLQARRTDIETMGTLAVGTLKAPQGREEELLDNLPTLARELIQKQ
jgi:hypothetical protein